MIKEKIYSRIARLLLKLDGLDYIADNLRLVTKKDGIQNKKKT